MWLAADAIFISILILWQRQMLRVGKHFFRTRAQSDELWSPPSPPSSSPSPSPPSVCYFGFDDPVNVLVQGHAHVAGRTHAGCPWGAAAAAADHDHHPTDRPTDIMITEVR